MPTTDSSNAFQKIKWKSLLPRMFGDSCDTGSKANVKVKHFECFSKAGNMWLLIYLSSSIAICLAWSDTNISWVLLRDLKTSVWTECFCTSCRRKIKTKQKDHNTLRRSSFFKYKLTTREHHVKATVISRSTGRMFYVKLLAESCIRCEAQTYLSHYSSNLPVRKHN